MASGNLNTGSVDDLLQSLNTSVNGLTPTEAARRLALNGPNSLKQHRRRHAVIEFLAHFKNPLVLILIGVAAVSLVLGQVVDAIIVSAMVLMSVTLNFFQEYQASNAAAKLIQKVAPTAVVVRAGQSREIPASQIVIGDVVELNAGDLIPADARVISAKDFFVNQSALTGESFPAEKFSTALSGPISDITQASNLVFMGTGVVTGTARVIITATARLSQFGQIAKQLDTESDENEFTKGINKFSLLILRIILFFVLFIFLSNTLIKHDILQSLLFAIAVAVGLTPEFLPMIMSVTMSSGSVAMAKKGVIVKRLTAIPTFGSMDILCTDKTGTLTEDHIRLVKCLDAEGRLSDEVFRFAYLNSHFQTGISNPLDTAILQHKQIVISKYKKLDEIPFDFQRRKMSVVVVAGSKRYLITKGAPEEIFSSSDLNPADKVKLTALYHDLSRDGFRVLAVAYKTLTDKRSFYNKQDENSLRFLGFTAFLDPAKPGVKQAIDQLEENGIEMKVITGDNELVAEKICRDAGINIKGILLSSELADISDTQLAKKALDSTVFARFSPDQKNRVINVLRSTGHVIGYLGDGINDAPSLKSADVGISVSNAVDVAKDSADIILTHKSLHELKDGVIEGRKTFGNTMKYIMMGLSSNFGNMFSVLGAVLFLPFLPMLPIQILLNNFLYDFGQLTIPTDKVDPEFIKKPKHWDIRFIRNFMFVFGPISSIFDFISFYVLFMLFKNTPALFQTGWFMESLATQTLVIHIIRTRKFPVLQSSASIYLWISTTLVVLVGWILPSTPLGRMFGLGPLPAVAILALMGIVFGYLIVVEFGKKLFYSKLYTS